MTVEFGVLGGVWATRDGAPVDLGGTGSARSSLGCSPRAAPSSRPTSWSPTSGTPRPRRAQAALQAHISHLRRALEPDRPPRTPAAHATKAIEVAERTGNPDWIAAARACLD